MRVFLLLCVLLAFVACKSGDQVKETKEAPTQTAESLYKEGVGFVEEEKYEQAIKKFELIEQEYPYSSRAAKAQLMTIIAQYRSEEYDDALLTIERFLKLHPGHKEVAHVYYLRALSFYDRILDVGRDQVSTQQAQQALKEVIARFPKSRYAKDATLKLDLVRDHLAGKEMEVGRFYLKQLHYIAAINRFKKVAEEYDKTNHVPEALHRLVEAYLSMGIYAEAKKYAAVLGHNYPESKWYQYSFRLMKKSKTKP